MAINTPSKQLFDLLVTKNFNPEMLDSAGRPVEDPSETEVFSFDWTAESGNDYGTVVIMLGNDQNLDVYFGDNLGRTMEGDDKSEWFDFLGQLKNFATRNLLSFGTKDLNRLRYSMQSQAAMKESIFESWTGTRTTSWNGRPTEARLMIKHKKTIDEGDARFRYIDSLFIETADSERYKLPFKSLTGGKAMLEHVRQGGKPYDARGQHITEVVTELNVLSRFRRANHGKIFEGDTATLVEQTNAYYESLQKTLKGLSKSRSYSTYFESWDPQVITEEGVTVEGLKHLFITQNIDQRVEDALPILAKIQQQGNAMKEANIFEEWANNLTEGTWALPDTPEKQQKLVNLMAAELPVGPDATNATEQLYDVIGDDELFDQLEELAMRDPDADARQVIYDRLQMLSDHPDVSAVITKLQNTPEEESSEEVAEGELDEFFVEEPTMNEEPSYNDDLAAVLKAAGVDDTVVAAPDYETGINEAATRKDFRKVADLIKQIPDDAKRRELAKHHADIFSQMNPRFNHATWNKYIGIEENLDDLDVDSFGGDSSDGLMADIDVNQNDDNMGEGLGGAVAGGALGALAAGPVGAVRGATIGNEIQNALADDKVCEEGCTCSKHDMEEGYSVSESDLSRIKTLAGFLVR